MSTGSHSSRTCSRVSSPRHPNGLNRPIVCIGTVVLAISMVFCGSSLAPAEQWTHLETNQTVQAMFLGVWGDNVVLRTEDGRRIVVPKEKLAAASRLQADELAAQKAELRQQRLSELAASSKPRTDVISETVAPYEPLPPTASLEETIKTASQQLEQGHVLALWDALPPSYQSDVQEFIKLVYQKTEQQEHASSFRLTAQLARTLIKQRDFFLNYPRLSLLPPEAVEGVRDFYDPVAGILSVLGDQEIFDYQELQSGNVQNVITKADQRLAPHISALLRKIPVEFNPLATIVGLESNAIQMSGDDQGEISVNTPDGQIQKIQFVKADGKWLPKNMAEQWSSTLTTLKQQAGAASPQTQQAKQATAAMTIIVGGALANIESAETQQEFNDVLDQYVDAVMGMVGGMMNQGGPASPGYPGMTGPGMAGPGMAAPGMAGPGMAAPGMAGPGMAAPGMAGPGMAAPGMAGPGMAGHGGAGATGPGMAGHDER